MIAKLEELEFADRELTPEEEELRDLLAQLIKAYEDERHDVPLSSPHETLVFLMRERGLRADLLRVFGSRSVVSDVVNGKRGISKAQAKKLAEFFHISADAFI